MALRRDEQHDRDSEQPDDWQRRAACRGEQSVAFFPPVHTERKPVRIERERRAKAVCRQCPVVDECLTYALDTREPHGVWGGLTEIERRDLLVRRADADDRAVASRGRGR